MANIYSASSLDGLEPEEEKLYRLITEYRAQNGLPAIPLSKGLTLVANRHVIDLAENVKTVTHAWSDAAYDGGNSSTWPSMWRAPQRFNTGYPGNGYEIAFGPRDASTSTSIANAESALKGWQGSPGHNNVILNRDVWTKRPWNAMGIGIYKGYAVVWFGEEQDPTGGPPVNVVSVRRVYDILTGSHVYTTDVDEVARITADTNRYRDEGNTFDSSGANQVSRFLNTVTGAFFYTISDAEKASVKANQGYREVPSGGFNASIGNAPGLVPVYRFFNTVTGRHFFTPNSSEASFVRSSLPGYRDEGIGFYADPLG
ncbi:CAP domain-containing protein [Limnothrix sp. FACHB-708]|uniref:CAP domain-containing protein n=1 Tax=unclassified Limnothrix TaxID=2632864 RepID=UPI0016851C52|nr:MULTISPECIES: CAP domain-containing protein [unclassified Limnothrix]MBD2554645.1 CAP domain-containing protein [Limnothrix sp. FACHB-708]MBD2591678.1 CAP domain-containing protein [Limnothrix sp. FACHB-406]